ncbi:unnamed protein product, partial [Brassica napus]
APSARLPTLSRSLPQRHVSLAKSVREAPARPPLNYNYHRAAGRILCRRLKYATGYCKWQKWPCCHDPLRFSPLSLRFDPPPF